MCRPQFLVSAILSLAVCISVSGQAHCQPAAPEKKGSDQDSRFKLDPFIATAIKADPADSPLRKLQKERCYERAIAMATIQEVIRIGRWQPETSGEYVRLQVTLFENLAELMDKPADKVKCYEMRVKALKDFEHFASLRVQVGSDPSQNLNLATAARIDAEIALLKLKTEIEKAGK